MPVVDASGKPGRGMLEGNIHMIGNFDQCKKIQHVITGGSRAGDVIAGSYCHVQFEIPLEHLPPIPGDVSISRRRCCFCRRRRWWWWCCCCCCCSVFHLITLAPAEPPSPLPPHPPCAIACINICAHVKNPKRWQPYLCLDRHVHAFRYVSPSLWNALPDSIKEMASIQSSRASLKCH